MSIVIILGQIFRWVVESWDFDINDFRGVYLVGGFWGSGCFDCDCAF